VAVIGVYDSGIGGLSVLRALREQLPGQDMIYLADSGHGPYGERESEHVRRRARRITAHLRQRRIDALVVACNTATAAAIEELRSEHPDLPIIGVEPALKPAVALSQTRRIGVLATRGTLQSDKFARLLRSLQDGQVQFVLRACDGLALAIENSLDGSADSAAALLECARAHVGALGACATVDGQIDTVVLGCTHYPLVAPLLQELVGTGVSLLETGPSVARQTRHRLGAAADSSAAAGPGRLWLQCTGTGRQLQQAASRWLDAAHAVESIDLPD
jgi:glutamate racemase